MHTQQQQFIAPYDATARLINEKGNQLYNQLLVFNISDTEIDEFGKYYFTHHHTGRRLFFSIQSSADIIYRSSLLHNKKLSETSFVDYGAGLGTLFLLAGMVGFKKVYFNDYFPQWAGYAKMICVKLNIHIDGYISGDIDAVIDYGKNNNVVFDIVASRNVVEHIYSLRSFYEKLYQSGLTSICYATTTANYHNPAMRLKHYFYHRKIEKTSFKKQREAYITELKPGIAATDVDNLVELTRGRAFEHFTTCVNLYFTKQTIQPVEFLGTNTCDCKTGVWAENLITKQNYFSIIEDVGFSTSFTAGFWDTHYKYAVVNIFTGILNRVVKLLGSKGYWLSPFVNVVAIKK